MTANHSALLPWAIRYIEKVTDELVSAHEDHLGKITEPDVRREVNAAKRWLKRAKAALERQPLAIGEHWYVRLPGTQVLTHVEVDSMTESTVILQRIGSCLQWRYARDEVRFVERVGK